MNVLLIISAKPYFTNAVYDYDSAFGQYSRHTIHYFDASQLPLDFDMAPFDAIVLSFSFFSCTWELPPPILAKFKAFHGPKIGIFQDEYDYFLRHRVNIRAMGLDTIITCVPEESWPKIFFGDFSHIPLVYALPGYVPETLLHMPPATPFAERPWYIGYRGRPVPYHYGELTREKYTIGLRMKELCENSNISANIDVTEEGRLYGRAWPDFLKNCRTMLGTESGCNVFDFDGSVIPAMQAYLAEHPGTSFEEAHERFLKPIDGVVRLSNISPKMFEAIALGTGLVLFEDEYSGVLTPWEHYIPLKKDYSNVDEVFAAVQNIPLLEQMTQKATEDIILSNRYSYQQLIRRIDDHLEVLQPNPQNLTPVYTLTGWRRADEPVRLLPQQPSLLLSPSPPLHTDNIWPQFSMRYVGKLALCSTWGKLTAEAKKYLWLKKFYKALRNPQLILQKIANYWKSTV